MTMQPVASSLHPIDAALADNAHALERAAPAVLKDLRAAVAALLDAGGWRDGPSAELSRSLGLDRSLAWKVWTLGGEAGALPSPQHVPGRAGVAKFLDAAEKAGAPADVIAQARDTFARYRELALQHAGDRASADILLGTLTPEGRERQDLSLRRGLFRGNSHVLGVQAALLYHCAAVFPGREGFFASVALVRGYFGLKTMRPGVSWVLGRSTLVQSTGPRLAPRRDTFDGDALDDNAPPLLPEFCRPTGVQVRRRVVEGRTAQDELEPRPIGREGAVDVVTGEVIRDIPIDRGPRDAVTMAVRVPAESLCFDVLLHRDAVAPDEATINCYSLVNNEFPFRDQSGIDEIPIAETLIEFGSPTDLRDLAGVAEHDALLARLISATGCRERDFRAVRFRMRFPPLPICIAIHYGARERPVVET